MAYVTPTVRAVGDVLSAGGDWNVSSADIAFLYGDVAWTAATLQNGWVTALSLPVRFRKIGTTVELDGAASTGAISTSVAMLTLPVGYRPSQAFWQVTVANNLSATVNVTTAGAVLPAGGSNAWFSVHGITFDTI